MTTDNRGLSERRFTPKDWRVAEHFPDHGQFSIVGPDGAEIAAVVAWVGKDRAEAEANACLIAAAPELLEALVAVRASTEWACMERDTQDRVTAAISKALNQEPSQ